ncbi:hypothetical protein EDD65_101134 [Keratinibaculum paraultunense]|uniref:PDZ domain-containing protein n=1 Tax=Keratinibaculum paraultunense TaxID=1278232 RepID=A0A4R3L0S3_9FIRM|nr:PDZ domain-containing protein [Keratinibaculum paraultunense]QQY80048.1 hypothetical protein JL105_01555 [Keratinibaculum paraultunense]TCS91631.1 hypothetical protein EDD65_101134 [Keratinibaculum paraultunense]
MDIIFQVIYYSLSNILSILKSPFFWVVVGIIYFQYRKISNIERNILGENRKSPLYNTLISLIFGLIGGILGSVILILSGITINPKDFYLMLPLAIILSLIDSRFICFSYAGGIISLISLVIGYGNINVSGIMFIVGVLHLVESFLILLDGKRSKIPIFVERKGEIVGGFMMNRFWPLPFNVFINNSYIYPAIVIAILGYGDYALTTYPEKKTVKTAGRLSLFSIILLLFANLSVNYPIFKYIAALFAPIGHEITIMIGKREEERGKYLFKASDYGLKILDSCPNSIGETMGLKPGDILLSINGHRIYSKEDMEEILFFRPKYIWIEVFDIEKGLITKEYKDYQRGIRNLGLVVVPKYPVHGIIVEEKQTPFKYWLDKIKNKKARFKN